MTPDHSFRESNVSFFLFFYYGTPLAFHIIILSLVKVAEWQPFGKFVFSLYHMHLLL